MTLTTASATTAAAASQPTPLQQDSQKKMDIKCSTTAAATTTIVATTEENLPTSEMDLLAKLEAANKLIESDAKSLNSLHSTHSRKNSDTSQISITSSKLSKMYTFEIGNLMNNLFAFIDGNSVAEEDIWTTWATILNDWDGALKRKNPCVRELVRRGIPHHFR